MGTEFWLELLTIFIAGILLVVIYFITRRLIIKYKHVKSLQRDMQIEQQRMQNDWNIEHRKLMNDQIWISSISGIIEYFRLSQINPESQRTMVFNNMVVFIYKKIRRDSPNTPNLTIYEYIAKAFSINNPNDIKNIVDNHIP